MTVEDAKKRMVEGRVYASMDPEILKEQALCLERLYDYNATRPHEGEKRAALLKAMFAKLGENAYIEPPLHANWGGKNVYVGKDFYANFNLTLVDDGEIHIGDNCMFAPNVVIATAGHPIAPSLRQSAMQYNIPVTIGNNVWIGANAVILPGVTVGDNTVIGAGSVVTRDLPANVVAYGNPCRVIREIGERDRIYYFRDRKLDLDEADFPAQKEK